MRLRTARLVSLAASLALLACAVSGMGYDRFRCAFTGHVSDVSDEDECCPAEDASPTPAVKAAPCCERETARSAQPPVEPTPSHVQLEATATPQGLAAPPAAAPARTMTAAAVASRPPPAPLHLLKHSLLI
jgi:hypothetical protein